MASLGLQTPASPVPSSVDAETLALTPSLHLPPTPGRVLEDAQSADMSPVVIADESQVVEETQGGSTVDETTGTMSAQHLGSTPALTEIEVDAGVLCQKLDQLIDIQRAILSELKAAIGLIDSDLGLHVPTNHHTYAGNCISLQSVFEFCWHCDASVVAGSWYQSGSSTMCFQKANCGGKLGSRIFYEKNNCGGKWGSWIFFDLRECFPIFSNNMFGLVGSG